MLDPKQLLEQFLGTEMGHDLRSASWQVKNRLDQAGGANAFAGGALAGGLLGMMLGGRRRSGGLVGYGGAAGSWCARDARLSDVRAGAGCTGTSDVIAECFGPPPTPSSSQPSAATQSKEAALALPHAAPAADGSPFELALVRAMIGAAKADGHIDATEQQRLFAEVERLGLDADAKAYLFDLLTQEIDVGSLANAVQTDAQGAELYLAARLGIDADEPAERAYLDELAQGLKLPGSFARAARRGSSRKVERNANGKR